ncbi:MAG: acetate--CoA ligase [Chloroflexi bacterium]|nr:MAG: acetate--CoA ligase [Chloroflexota bacterium]
MYRRSIEDPEGFWSQQAERLDWFERWHTVLDWQPPFARWFVGGRLNASYQCLDRHMNTETKNKVAIYWEGEPGDTRTLSYADLYREVNRCAAVLTNLGVKKGDVVALYLPMIPELPIFMLACARIGAPHTVVFSGFSASALADRMNELGVKLLVTADGGYRRGKVVPLKNVADEAISLVTSLEHQVVVKRTGIEVEMTDGRDVWLHEAMPVGVVSVDPEPVEATHPLYILFTSGTTGKPKGIVHGTGGYLVYSESSFRWVFNTDDNSVYWCTADIGWVTGHTYNVYAPLMAGVTQVMYEGAPDYPDLERWWQIVERYGVTHLYTSPTAVRMFMAHGEEPVRRHDLSSLELLGSVGEPINPEAWRWYYETIGGSRCPIVDTWWQTETGAIMLSGTPGIEAAPLKPGSAGLPLPGADLAVVNAEGEEVPAGERGLLVIRRPWPGMLAGIHDDPERYTSTYWARFPGLYYAGDYARRDDDGYFWLLGRADEVLKVAGHRLGSLELESAAVTHPAVAEAAAVARPDDIKGEVVVLFAVLVDAYDPSDDLVSDVKSHMRETMGPIGVPEDIFFVRSLPKTRSGKIMRRVIAAVASDREVGDLTTLEDEGTVDEAKRAYRALREAVDA